MSRAVAVLAVISLFGCGAKMPDTPVAAAQCEPARVVVQTPTMAPNSTYTSDAEPPERYRGMPKGFLQVYLGQANIDAICGQPPCNKHFEGCVRGSKIALLDPFTTKDADWMRVFRHELGHMNGWPETHGD
jgi:hypothetical protein